MLWALIIYAITAKMRCGIENSLIDSEVILDLLNSLFGIFRKN
jgi:hypothetical protein